MKTYLVGFITYGGKSVVKWLDSCVDFFDAAEKAKPMLGEPQPEIPDLPREDGAYDHLRSARLDEHRQEQQQRRWANEDLFKEVEFIKPWPFNKSKLEIREFHSSGMPEALTWDMYTPFIKHKLMAAGCDSDEATLHIIHRTAEARAVLSELQRQAVPRPIHLRSLPQE